MKNRGSGGDLELVEACLKGDITAWTTLAQKYSRLIYFAIDKRARKYGLALSPQDIEDIRQEILTSIWRDRKLEGVQNRKDISCWLAIVSGNAGIESLRKKRILGEPKLMPFFDNIPDDEMEKLMPEVTSLPSDELSRSELSERIDGAMEALPSRERLIAKLNLCHDKKYNEIAEILGIPVGTVSSYIKRAKERLRKKLRNL